MGKIFGYVALAGIIYLTIKQMRKVKEQENPKIKK